MMDVRYKCIMLFSCQEWIRKTKSQTVDVSRHYHYEWSVWQWIFLRYIHYKHSGLQTSGAGCRLNHRCCTEEQSTHMKRLWVINGSIHAACAAGKIIQVIGRESYLLVLPGSLRPAVNNVP